MSLHICAVSPEPLLLAHTSGESRGTFRQKARSLAPLNGWACAVRTCHDGMLEDTNSLDGAQLSVILWNMCTFDCILEQNGGNNTEYKCQICLFPHSGGFCNVFPVFSLIVLFVNQSMESEINACDCCNVLEKIHEFSRYLLEYSLIYFNLNISCYPVCGTFKAYVDGISWSTSFYWHRKHLLWIWNVRFAQQCCIFSDS